MNFKQFNIQLKHMSISRWKIEEWEEHTWRKTHFRSLPLESWYEQVLDICTSISFKFRNCIQCSMQSCPLYFFQPRIHQNLKYLYNNSFHLVWTDYTKIENSSSQYMGFADISTVFSFIFVLWLWLYLHSIFHRLVDSWKSFTRS